MTDPRPVLPAADAELEKAARTVAKFLCPYCEHEKSHVTHTRPLASTYGVWRRRQCLNPACGKAFTTEELIKKSDAASPDGYM